MTGIDAGKSEFEEIELFGKPALFTERRVDTRTVPDGLHYYEIRGDDDGGFSPAQAGRCVIVNHYGGVLTRRALKLGTGGYIGIDPDEDFHFIGGDHMTAAEFIQKYPLHKKREKER